MKRHEIPTIAALDERDGRPFWSVMIPTYNAPDLLAETLKCVLDQDPGREQMQIEVVDDASTGDETQAVVRRIAGTRVSYFRQAHNIGAPANFTTCIERSVGRWVHILHTDDMALPGFYDAYRAYIEAHRCEMVVGPSKYIDEQGQRLRISRILQSSEGPLVDALEVLAKYNPLSFASVVVARTAYEMVGGFDRDLVHANDWEMWTRLAASVPVGYIPVPYSAYRVHPRSDTNKLRQSSLYLTDPLAALAIVATRFDNRKVRWGIRYWTHVRLQSQALLTSRRCLANGQLRPAVRHALWAVRLRPSPQSFVVMAAVGRGAAVASSATVARAFRRAARRRH